MNGLIQYLLTELEKKLLQWLYHVEKEWIVKLYNIKY